jgi:hypothetical protein
MRVMLPQMTHTSRGRAYTFLLIANSSASNGWIHTFKRRHITAFGNLSGESRRVVSETAEDWKNYQLLQ